MGEMATSDGANAGLRRRVLALVRASRPAARARHSQLSTAFARLSTACGALAAAASTASGGGSRPTERLETKEHGVREELERLSARVAFNDSSTQLELPLLVARRFNLKPEPQPVAPRRASRKRRRADSVASLGGDEDDGPGRASTPWTAALPTRLSSVIGDLLLVWALHTAALVRLDALLVAMEGDTTALCRAIRLVLGEDSVALPASCQWAFEPDFRLRERLQGLRGGDSLQAWDSHALVKCVVAQLVQLSFRTATDGIDSPRGREEETQLLPARAASSALEELCSLSPSLPPEQQTQTLCVVINALPSGCHSPARTDQGSDEVDGDRQRVADGGSPQIIAFLSSILYSFLCRAAKSQADASVYGSVVDAVLQVLPSPAIAQVVRRFLTYEHDTSATSFTPPTGPTSSSSSSRSIRGAVFELIKRCSSVDEAFNGVALTLAHELAEDAVLRGKPWLLGSALELVATVATSPQASSNCYKDWFQAHFGNNPAVDELKTSDDAWQCLKHSKTKTPDACRLIRSKSHLQLVCLFLLEFDRRVDEASVEASESAVDRVVWTSAHVMTHLSVLKSFQGPNASENALVIDFCAEARVCYANKLSQEQQAGRGLSPSSSSPSTLASAGAQPRKYSSDAKAVVDENVAYYKKHRCLSPQLQQWKTFQYLKWKSDILPCCLDVTLDDHWAALDPSAGANGGQHSNVVAQLHFVFALARANMVPADDYARFLAKIQTWVDHTRATIAHDMQRKRQRDVASSLHRTIRRLRRICQCGPAVSDKPRKTLLAECLSYVSESVFAYLDAHAAHADPDNAADIQSRQEPMDLLWTSAFVEVLSAIGLDGLEAFYAFQIALVVKLSRSSNTNRSTSISEHNSFLKELYNIALAHRPSSEIQCIEWTACFAGVVAGMFAVTNHQPAPVIPADVLREFSVIESATSARGLPTQKLLKEKTLLFTCFLRALTTLQTIHPEVDIHASCTLTFPAHTLDFWSWVAYRDWREGQRVSVLEADTNGDEVGELDASDWIYQGQRTLLRTKWLGTFRERWRATETARNMLDFEFRCGSVSTSAHRPVLGNEDVRTTYTSTLLRHIEIIDGTDGSQPPNLWCQWLIDEIFCLAAGPPLTSDTNANEGTRAKDAIHEGLQAATLLLNELVHRLLRDFGQDNGGRCSLLSQWVERTVEKLRSINEEASKQILYQYSYEILSVLSSGESTLPQLQTRDEGRLEELMRLVARDLSQEHLSASVRLSLVRPLLELAAQRHDGIERSMEEVTTIPVALLVEWAELQADGGYEERVEKQDRRLLAVLEWLGRAITAMISSGIGKPSDQSKSVFFSIQEPTSSTTTASSVFPAASEALKFLVRAAGYALDRCTTHAAITRGDIDQRMLSARLHRMAEVVLDACCGSNWNPTAPDRTANGALGYDGDSVHTLGPWFFEYWRDQVTAGQPRSSLLLFHLLLLHMTALLCTRSAHASKKLLGLRPCDYALRGVFIVLVASVATDSGQLDAILARNSSLWVNAFPDAALAAISRPPTDHKARGLPAGTPTFEDVLGGTAAFRDRASALVSAVFTYGVEHQVDLLDASLRPRVVAQWPHLESLAAQLPVLSLEDDMGT